MNLEPRERLIVALDVAGSGAALELFEELHDGVGMFKVGAQLFTSAGPDIVRELTKRGGKIFLDLKFHDIPNTVASAAVNATRLGVSIFNVHASGGLEMMKRTVEAVAETATRENLPRPRIIGVTLLTSLNGSNLQQLGVADEPVGFVKRLARLTAEAGLDGVVASARDITTIRETISDPNFLVVTPGIRSGAGPVDDQRRTMTAAEAVKAGADYFVVGRPILNAKDRRQAVRALLDEVSARAVGS